MKGSLNQPKIFISYSWSSPKHEQWVLDLAERLFSDGIVVVLDKWDLKEGQDKHSFMEQMVNDTSILKVLVICDAVYQSKANVRKGGVGTESLLISKEVYENAAQEKFIPIVCEYDSENKPCIPVFMASRIYVDLSLEDKFEENYQKLVRNIYNKPELRKPTLGVAPGYITEDDPIVIKTSHKVQEIKTALINGKPIARALIADYYDLFFYSIDEFRISGGEVEGFDDKVIKSIEQMLPLRNDFIDFTLVIFRYQDSVDLESLKEFFERLIVYQFPPESATRSSEVDCDNYNFFCYELMLYFIATLFKLKKYSEAAYFIHEQYYYKRPHYQDLRFGSIEQFNRYTRSLDQFRNNRLQLRRISVTADLIKERSNRKDLNFDEIRSIDLTLFYLRTLSVTYGWFPRTSVYESWTGSSIDIFQRQISAQFFEKIKVLYDVNTKDELKKKIDQYVVDLKEGKKQQFDNWDYRVLPVEHVIKISEVATLR